MSEHLQQYDAEAVSLALGHAWGLLHMCLGQMEAEEPERCDVRDLRITIRHVLGLLKSAESSAAQTTYEVRRALEEAASVCAVLASDLTVEFVNREGQHWSDEITNWALGALAQAIEAAKAIVDGRREVAHV